MKDTSYMDSMNYEHFMRRALKSRQNVSNGADACHMQNLIWASQGSGNVAHLGSYDKQLKDIKKYLSKAFDKFLSRKLTDIEKIQLTEQKNLLDRAYGIDELLQICDKCEEITRNYKY